MGLGAQKGRTLVSEDAQRSLNNSQLILAEIAHIWVALCRELVQFLAEIVNRFGFDSARRFKVALREQHLLGKVTVLPFFIRSPSNRSTKAFVGSKVASHQQLRKLDSAQRRLGT